MTVDKLPVAGHLVHFQLQEEASIVAGIQLDSSWRTGQEEAAGRQTWPEAVVVAVAVAKPSFVAVDPSVRNHHGLT